MSKRKVQKQVEELIERLGSVVALAEAVETSVSTVVRWRRGECEPRPVNQQRLIALLVTQPARDEEHAVLRQQMRTLVTRFGGVTRVASSVGVPAETWKHWQADPSSVGNAWRDKIHQLVVESAGRRATPGFGAVVGQGPAEPGPTATPMPKLSARPGRPGPVAKMTATVCRKSGTLTTDDVTVRDLGQQGLKKWISEGLAAGHIGPVAALELLGVEFPAGVSCWVTRVGPIVGLQSDETASQD